MALTLAAIIEHMGEQPLIVPGDRVGKLRLGASGDDLQSLLGEPEAHERGPVEQWLLYPDYLIQVWPIGCVYIEVTTDVGGRLPSGVAVGATWADLADAYPTTHWDDEVGDWVPDRDSGVLFRIKRGDGAWVIGETPPQGSVVGGIGIGTSWLDLDMNTGRPFERPPR